MRERGLAVTVYGVWCNQDPLQAVGPHQSGVISSTDDALGIETLSSTLPTAYVKPTALALIAQRHGKPGVAAYLRTKLPQKANARSGDLGEILATAYIHEALGDVVGPSRLRDRDHQEWAMRGDDVLGARFRGDGSLHITKVEAKSRTRLGESTVKDARKGLERNAGLPSPHSLSQFAERLVETEDSDVGEALLNQQLTLDIRPDDLSHVMFLFTSSDPSAHVTADLKGYSGPVRQLTVTLRVLDHGTFVKESYERVTASGS